MKMENRLIVAQFIQTKKEENIIILLILDVLTFETEAEASAFIKEVNKKAKEYHEEYINLERTGDRDLDYEKVCKPFFDKIEGKMENGTDSVYWRAFSGLNEEKRNGNPEYKMEVVQVVCP